jgi:hypothetical protein
VIDKQLLADLGMRFELLGTLSGEGGGHLAFVYFVGGESVALWSCIAVCYF